MTPDLIQTVRELSKAIRTIATRKTVVEADEQDLRLVAASLDDVALALGERRHGK